MSFGSKIGSVSALKKSLEKTSSSGGDVWVKYIPKNSDLVVRFLTEPDEWVLYSEAWDSEARNGKGSSYPISTDMVIPDDQRVSKRYLAAAVDIDGDRVVPVCIPRSLMQQVISRYERYGTMVDRDYALSRSGAGLDTTYMMDPEPPLARKLDKYSALDLEAVLAAAYDSYLIENGGDQIAPAPVEDIPVHSEVPVVAVEATPDDESDEDAISREDLSEMTVASLRAIARGQKLTVGGFTKDEIIDAILGADSF